MILVMSSKHLSQFFRCSEQTYSMQSTKTIETHRRKQWERVMCFVDFFDSANLTRFKNRTNGFRFECIRRTVNWNAVEQHIHNTTSPKHILRIMKHIIDSLFHQSKHWFFVNVRGQKYCCDHLKSFFLRGVSNTKTKRISIYSNKCMLHVFVNNFQTALTWMNHGNDLITSQSWTIQFRFVNERIFEMICQRVFFFVIHQIEFFLPLSKNTKWKHISVTTHNDFS